MCIHQYFLNTSILRTNNHGSGALPVLMLDLRLLKISLWGIFPLSSPFGWGFNPLGHYPNHCPNPAGQR